MNIKVAVFYPEILRRRIIENVGADIPVHTASHPGRANSKRSFRLLKRAAGLCPCL